MKLQNITLILTLLGILILSFLSQAKPIHTDTIKSIQTSQFKTTIHLENQATELIIFGTPTLNLNPKDKIKFQGKPDTYKNKKQIIIEKILILNKNS